MSNRLIELVLGFQINTKKEQNTKNHCGRRDQVVTSDSSAELNSILNLNLWFEIRFRKAEVC